MKIPWDELTTDETLALIDLAPHPLGVIAGEPAAVAELEQTIEPADLPRRLR